MNLCVCAKDWQLFAKVVNCSCCTTLQIYNVLFYFFFVVLFFSSSFLHHTYVLKYMPLLSVDNSVGSWHFSLEVNIKCKQKSKNPSPSTSLKMTRSKRFSEQRISFFLTLQRNYIDYFMENCTWNNVAF